MEEKIIMSYTINTPDVLHAGGYVQHGLENAGAVIAASNYEIANAIYGASESLLNGFGKIRLYLEK